MRTEKLFDKEKSLDKVVKIKFLGEEFIFKPNSQIQGSQRIVDDLEHYILTAEKQFDQKTSNKNKIAILLLAAMNISKDLHELKMKYSGLEDYVSEKIAILIKKIDNIS